MEWRRAAKRAARALPAAKLMVDAAQQAADLTEHQSQALAVAGAMLLSFEAAAEVRDAIRRRREGQQLRTAA